MSDSVWPHRRQPTRRPCPWDSPGKNTEMGCHFILQCMKVKSESEDAQSCPTLHDPMDCSPPGSGFSRQEYWSGVLSPPLPQRSPLIPVHSIQVPGSGGGLYTHLHYGWSWPFHGPVMSWLWESPSGAHTGAFLATVEQLFSILLSWRTWEVPFTSVSSVSKYNSHISINY